MRELDYKVSVIWMTNGKPYRSKIIIPWIQVQGEESDWWLLMTYVLKVHHAAVDKGARPKKMIWRVQRV